ncbi:MAG: phosphoglycolate phosphatase [Burkholderiales bacterium]|nr:phosphoglycolate phosphatase [Burkholderiales bacterium]
MTVPLQAVLFDLDGTLVDSAPDLAAAANAMRAQRGLAPVPYEELRPLAGSGARGMLGRTFGRTPGDADYVELRDEFHALYERCMLASTQAFEGIDALLGHLQARGLRWGIVTNKARRFAGPMVQALQPLGGSATLVCGDCTPHTKPHPAPLLEAARRLGLDPASCVYVGDDKRDVEAGRAAGMRTVAVAWGYLGAGASVTSVHEWSAGHVIHVPADLLTCLDLP